MNYKIGFATIQKSLEEDLITQERADILKEWLDKYSDKSCTCYMAAPCIYCESMPVEFADALDFINEQQSKNFKYEMKFKANQAKKEVYSNEKLAEFAQKSEEKPLAKIIEENLNAASNDIEEFIQSHKKILKSEVNVIKAKTDYTEAVLKECRKWRAKAGCANYKFLNFKDKIIFKKHYEHEINPAVEISYRYSKNHRMFDFYKANKKHAKYFSINIFKLRLCFLFNEIQTCWLAREFETVELRDLRIKYSLSENPNSQEVKSFKFSF